MGRRTLLLIASILIAAVGTALIGLYVRGADSRARQTEGMVSTLVALRDIKAGDSAETVLAAIGARDVPRPMAVNGFYGNGALARLTKAVKGQTVVVAIQQQQVITAAMFGGPGEAATGGITNQRGVVVELTDPARAAGLLVPGSHVTVYLVPDDNDSIKQKYHLAKKGEKETPGRIVLSPEQVLMPVIVQDARVMGIGNQKIGTGSDDGKNGAAKDDNVARTNVTLDLSIEDADKVVSAEAFGELYFAVHKATS